MALSQRKSRVISRASRHRPSSTPSETVVSRADQMSLPEEDEATVTRKKFQDIEERRVKEWENYQRSQRGTMDDAKSIAFLDICIADVPCGRLIIELFDDAVPETVANFRALCTGEKLYDANGTKLDYIDSPFHKIVKGVGAYGGELNNVSIAATGSKIKEENFSLRHSQRGVLSMMSNGPNSVGSTFCVTFNRLPDADFKQVVFGKIMDGMSVLDKLEQAPTNARTGVPKVPVTVSFCGALTGKRPSGVHVSLDDTRAPSELTMTKEPTETEDIAIAPTPPDEVVTGDETKLATTSTNDDAGGNDGGGGNPHPVVPTGEEAPIPSE